MPEHQLLLGKLDPGAESPMAASLLSLRQSRSPLTGLVAPAERAKQWQSHFVLLQQRLASAARQQPAELLRGQHFALRDHLGPHELLLVRKRQLPAQKRLHHARQCAEPVSGAEFKL